MPRKQVQGTCERMLAYEGLRKELTLRRIVPGEKLRESEWTRRLGVNRSALREALARLHSEGLVIEGSRCGYRVPDYTPRELEQIREVCRMVERGAAELIVAQGRTQEADLRPLSDSCDELEWVIDRSYHIDLTEIDQRFHQAFVHLSGQRRLATLRGCLPQAVDPEPGAYGENRSDAARRMLHEHRTIVVALARGDLDEALTLIDLHYRRSEPFASARSSRDMAEAVSSG